MKTPIFPLCASLLVIFTGPATCAEINFTNVADNRGTYFEFWIPAINTVGTVAFSATFDSGGGGLFGINGNTTKTILNFPVFNAVTLSSTGKVAYVDALNNSNSASGLYTSDGTTITTIAIAEPPVGPNLFFIDPYRSLNTAGTLAFSAVVAGGSGGIFSSNGTTTTTIALTSGPILSGVGGPSINTAGAVGFTASLDAGGTGLFTGDGVTTTPIALSIGPIFSGFSGAPSLNSSGLLAFQAELDAGGSGLFVSDGTTTTTIALSSGPIFSGFSKDNFSGRGYSLNDAGTMGFLATLDAGGTGIFTGDGTTITPVIKIGDLLFGSRVIDLEFGRGALNDAGQLAFLYYLADGREGIAVANTVPEPGSALLMAGGALALLTRRRADIAD